MAVTSTTGDPIALRLYCGSGETATRCQGAIDARPAEGTLIEGFDWEPSSAPRAEPLVFRASASSDPPALALTDGAIFHADRVERRGLLRRLAVTWR